MIVKNESNFFENIKMEELSGVAYKNVLIKKKIINHISNIGTTTIPELSKAINISVPKTSLLLQELIDHGLIRDYGKQETALGRKPNIYGLRENSMFFLGVEVNNTYINIGVTNFKKQLVKFAEKVPYQLHNTQESLDNLCTLILEQIHKMDIPRDKILGLGINLGGRINYKTGYSYSYFNFSENPLSKVFRQKTGFPTFLENDSRAMAFGEFKSGLVTEEKNVLFLNLDYGIGMGIMLDGNLVYGKSGFAGEFGHIPMFDNEIICHCGKKGCLETEASGKALIDKFYERVKAGSQSMLNKIIESEKKLKLDDIIKAVFQDDVLAIEIIDEAGKKLGKGIATLLQLYNPELIILGGALSQTGDYILLPIKMAIKKYTLSLVSNDSKILVSQLGKKAGVIGACLLVRNRLLAEE